jgi:hypothetical protein
MTFAPSGGARQYSKPSFSDATPDKLVTSVTPGLSRRAVSIPNSNIAIGGAFNMAYVDHFWAPNYPYLVAFVENDLSDVPNRPQIFNPFMKYAQYKPTRAKSVFWWFMNPIIQIEPLKDAWAEYRPDFPWNIYVDREWADRFEKDVPKPLLTAKAKLLMEACILHEMCHRGDFADGVEQALEPGIEFEKAAYGAVQDQYWVGPTTTGH